VVDENTYVNIDMIYHNLMNSPPSPAQIKMVDTANAAQKAASNFRFGKKQCPSSG
jgi:hypothetical protein